MEERGRILRLLDEYVRFGGYPKVVLSEDYELKNKILKTYYETIFYRDLIERYKVDPILMDNFLRYVIKCFTNKISISKIHNFLKSIGLKCSKNTLIKFLKYAEEIFLLIPMEIFSYNIKDRKQYPKKIHVIDNGIIRALYPEVEEEYGKLMENTVAIELIRRIGDVRDISYWKEYGKRDGNEVDFVIRSGSYVKEVIQVTYANSKSEIHNREIKSLMKASKELNCKI
ncbi:MAG: DUF4143 domain-containing protein [Candidatus Methanomethylicia archaeon]